VTELLTHIHTNVNRSALLKCIIDQEAKEAKVTWDNQIQNSLFSGTKSSSCTYCSISFGQLCACSEGEAKDKSESFLPFMWEHLHIANFTQRNGRQTLIIIIKH